MGPCHPNTKEQMPRLCFPKTRPRHVVTKPRNPLLLRRALTLAPVCTSLLKPLSTAQRPSGACVPSILPQAHSKGGAASTDDPPYFLSSRSSHVPSSSGTLRSGCTAQTHVPSLCPADPSPPLPVLCPSLPHTADSHRREDGPPYPPGWKSEAGRPGTAPTRGTPGCPPKPSVTWVTRTLCGKIRPAGAPPVVIPASAGQLLPDEAQKLHQVLYPQRNKKSIFL